MTPDPDIAALLALPDAALIEAVAVEVMGWTKVCACNTSWWKSDDENESTPSVYGWNPLSDLNQTHQVIERMRERWAAEGSNKTLDVEDLGGPEQTVYIRRKIGGEACIRLCAVRHLSFARAALVAALWGRRPGEPMTERDGE